jgi:DNA-binding SARP family transcriptional activator/tetratricopeptide (TPR) repeat protein
LEGQLWLRMLGPVQVWDGAAWIRPPGPQLRLLLACVALPAGQVVPVDDLIDVLWEDRLPPSARASLQVLVVRLRKTLAGLPGCAVERYGEGYQLRAPTDMVDVHRFRSLVSSAREADDDDRAIAAFGQALALWRGPALADVPGTARVEAIRAGLAEEQLSAVQDRFGCLLAAGRDGQAAAEIPLVLARHPLAERLAGLLMVAWYRCGRQADALRVFRDLRGRLAGELAVEPGPGLQRLHQRILCGDPALAAPGDLAGLLRGGAAASANSAGRDAGIWPVRPPAPADPPGRPGSGNGLNGARTPGNRQHGIEMDLNQPVLAGDAGLESPLLDGNARRAGMGNTAAAVVPRQLPAAPAHFAGRHRELSWLTARLDAGTAAGQPVILAIGGTAGVGKTALALYWARQMQRRFPDGQLYVNLRGFDASSAPVAPADALTALLESLDMPAGRISPRLDARAGLYRSLLAGRRMLIVLDNARDEAQVRSLLPGDPACVVLVTGRSQFAGLVAAEGARPLTLDVLSETEARQLLATHLGTERVAAEAVEVAELTALCARLPLALAITAARAALRPEFPLASLAADLRDVRQRLDWLDAGDQAADVRAVFFWSYRLLGESAARMFRLLGIHPGPDITAAAAASLTGIPPAQAPTALAELTRAHLLTEYIPGRFAFHDLLRAYATERAHADDSLAERRAAIHRALDHYLHTANNGMLLIDEAPWPLMPQPHQPGAVPEELGSYAQAMAWFTAEHPVLRAMICEAAHSGFHAHASQLPAAMESYLSRTGRWDEWATVNRTALAAARRLGDQQAQARAHYCIGHALYHKGSRRSGRPHIEYALRLLKKIGDGSGQARTHTAIASALGEQRRYGQALEHAECALHLCQKGGDRAGQAFALNEVGWYHAALGDHQRALRYCAMALAQHRELGHRFGEASTLDSLGYCCHQAGRYDEAAAYYQQALRALADVGDRYFRAHTLIHLGETHHATGHHEATRDAWQQALAILDDLHHPDAATIRGKLHDLTASVTT